jgi:hypothetical protein
MNKLILTIGLIGSTLFSFGQEAENKNSTFESKVINTDRGTFTKSAVTVGKGLQFEAGMNHDWIQSTNPVFKTTVFNPFQGQMRLGLSKDVEFNLAISNNELVVRNWDGSATDKYNYWSPMEIGLRVRFLDKAKYNMSAYVSARAISTQRDVVDSDGNAQPWVLVARPNYVGPEFALLGNAKLGQRFELAYNFGIRWTGIQLEGAESANRPDVYYTLRALYHIATPLDFYVEHFNYFRKGFYPTLGLNGGFRYAISSKFVVDVNGGLGFNEFSPEAFFGGGLTYRLGK